VMNKSFGVQLIQFFIRSLDRPNLQFRIFFTREDAMSWLQRVKDASANPV
jgi:hypothetical protein